MVQKMVTDLFSRQGRFIQWAAVLFVLLGCASTESRFFEMAFGAPSTEKVSVVDYESEVVDNLFKSEYTWLLSSTSAEFGAWLHRLEAAEITDPYDLERLSKIAQKFETQEKGEVRGVLYRAGEGVDGREHYLFILDSGNVAVYHVATI